MLMTALSACIGLLPAALSTGIGSQVQRPLATVIVGGLLIGPIMLLVVVPTLCLIFLSKQDAADTATSREGNQSQKPDPALEPPSGSPQ
jgi:cobalt-zinc-cadmium resistance protein CzcA